MTSRPKVQLGVINLDTARELQSQLWKSNQYVDAKFVGVLIERIEEAAIPLKHMIATAIDDGTFTPEVVGG